MNAHEKAAVVYSNPRRKKYCASVTLKYIYLSIINKIDSIINQSVILIQTPLEH